ncbi:MAG: hypothetical protein EBE86_012775 [Hormoscilla sp. GUM202]|nr:hypothetical protein [Hormoscilla sp. GUM202]
MILKAIDRPIDADFRVSPAKSCNGDRSHLGSQEWAIAERRYGNGFFKWPWMAELP